MCATPTRRAIPTRRATPTRPAIPTRRATQQERAAPKARALRPARALRGLPTWIWVVAALLAPPAHAEPDASDPSPRGASPPPEAASVPPGQRETPDAPSEIPEGQIEILAGSKRIRVPSSVATPENDGARENGVLPIRGATVGVPESRFEINRNTVSTPMRARLRARLRAVIAVHREAFELPVAPDVAAALETLNPLEDDGPGADPLLRSAYHHDLPAPRSDYRRATERALIARALHATSHALVDRYWPDAPFWLDEGLAVAFEGIDSVDGDITLELRPEHVDRLASLRRGEPWDPQELLALERETFARLASSVSAQAQTQLGALVLYLLEDPGFVEAIAARAAASRGSTPVGADLRVLQAVEIDVADAAAYTDEWRLRRSAPGRVRILAAPEPPAPKPERKRRVRRDFRCVPATVGVGTPNARMVLFCTRGNRLLQRGVFLRGFDY